MPAPTVNPTVGNQIPRDCSRCVIIASKLACAAANSGSWSCAARQLSIKSVAKVGVQVKQNIATENIEFRDFIIHFYWLVMRALYLLDIVSFQSASLIFVKLIPSNTIW